jgi:hypothetical protein
MAHRDEILISLSAGWPQDRGDEHDSNGKTHVKTPVPT